MRKANDLNINTRFYWNDIYADSTKRQAYIDDHTGARTTRFSTALSYIKPGDHVLDMGCGVGNMGKLVKDTFPTCDVWGADISTSAIEANQKERPDITWHAQYIGAQDLLPDAYFDLVFCGETLEHMEEPSVIFTDAFRLLKPGGTLIITTPRGMAIQSPEHTWFFEPEDVATLYQENGFSAPEFVELPGEEHYFVIYAVGRRAK